MSTPKIPPPHWQDIPGAPEVGTRLAHIDEIVDGAAILVTLDTCEPPFKVIILRSDTQLFAYVNRCAHFGVPLANRVEHLYPEAHQNIRCSVHYARYRWQDGLCISGECEGESLIPIPVTISGEHVLIAANEA